MKSFRYWRDPLCLAACALYVINRFWLRQHVGGTFLVGYFNDLLLIPAALPGILWVQRQLRVRPNDARPTWAEIGLHLVVWSILAEVALPHVSARYLADWKDVLAYAAGAAAAGCWWQVGLI